MSRAAKSQLASLSLRLLLGLLVLGSGIGKLLDVGGFARVLGTYELGLSEGALLALSVAVIAYELALGIWMLSGKSVAWSALANAVTSFGYVVFLSATLLRGLDLRNCGCFGIFLARPLTWMTPLEDVVLVALSLILFRLARKSGTALPRPEGLPA